MRLKALRITSIGAVFLAGFSLFAADWLQFRGPGGLGIADGKNLPTTWSATSNVLWKTELPGAGASSPIVVGKKIYLTCYSGYGVGAGGKMSNLKRHLVCLDRGMGKTLWTRDFAALLPETDYSNYQALHGYASSTPVSDGERVFIFLGKSGVFAYDLDGTKLWQKSVGEGKHNWGSGTSPLLYKDLVICNASVESGSLIALKKSDGKVAWTAKGVKQSWNTPLLVDVGGKQELVVNIKDQVRAYNPDTGRELWSCAGITDYVCPSFVAHNGILFVVGGRNKGGLAIKAGGSGTVKPLWRVNKGSNVSSPVYHDGHFYWANEGSGIVFCVKADNGALVYQERLTPTPGRIYASPVVADGKIYYVSREGGAFVVAAGPQFKQLAHNKLGDSSVFNASPVVHDDQILLRSDRYLYCIGKN
jgi:outer membrane protein assembly factor BamB